MQMSVDSINRNVIFTDSKSTADSLYNKNGHPVIRFIVHKLNILKNKNIVVEICWIPSHVGMDGNEKVDGKEMEISKV